MDAAERPFVIETHLVANIIYNCDMRIRLDLQ